MEAKNIPRFACVCGLCVVLAVVYELTLYTLVACVHCLLQVVVESVPMALFMEGLRSRDPFRLEALITVGNIAAGTETQTQALLDAGLLSHMGRLLRAGNMEVRSLSAH